MALTDPKNDPNATYQVSPAGEPQDDGQRGWAGPASSAPAVAAAPKPQAQPQVQSDTAQPTQNSTPPVSSVATPAIPPSSNPRLHGFVAATLNGILSTLAGKPATRYTTDPSGRVIADSNQLTDSTGDKFKRLASHALEGLAAGSRVPQQKSGLASALAGLGAGSEAAGASANAQDAAGRQKAREDDDAQQRKMFQMHDIAKLNGATYAEIQNAKAKGEEGLKQHYQDTQSLLEAAKEGGLDATIMSPEQGAALIAKERAGQSSAFVKHVVLGLLAPTPIMQDGQPVLDEYGEPKTERQVAVITEDKNGDVVVNNALAKRIQRVAEFAHITGTDSLQAGDAIPWDKFKRLITDTKHAENQITSGKREFVFVNDGQSGRKLQVRNTLGEMSDPTADEQLTFQERQAKLGKEQQDIKTGKSTETKNYAEARKALADSNGTTEEIAGQGIDLVEGDMDPTQVSKRSKTYNEILSSARKYSMEKYGKPFDLAKAQSDYKFSTNVQTQNTLKYLNSLTGADNKSGNLQALIDASDKIDRSEFPPLNDTEAWLKITTGDPQMASYKTAVLEVADQAAKILQGGGTGAGTSDAKLRQAQELFDVKFTKKQTRGIAETLRTLLGNRKKEMVGDNRYLLRQYSQQSTPSQNPEREQVPSGVPQGATHIYKDTDGKVVGYALDGKYVPLQAGKQ